MDRAAANKTCVVSVALTRGDSAFVGLTCRHKQPYCQGNKNMQKNMTTERMDDENTDFVDPV